MIYLIEFSWLTLFAITVTSILLHELGHWALLSKYTMRNNINITLANKNGWALHVGENKDYLQLSQFQRNRVYVIGFVTQTLWILLCSIMLHWLYIMILPFAILVSQNDFQLMKGAK